MGSRLYSIALVVLVPVAAKHLSSEELDTETIDPSRPQISLPVPEHWRHPLNCGVVCSYLLLRLCSRQVDLSTVFERIPVEAQKGSNLAKMRDGCRSLGLEVDVIQTAPSQFQAIRWPAIAHVLTPENPSAETAHFVVVLGVGRQNVRIIDPSEARVREVSREEFFRKWSGYLLIPSTARRHLHSSMYTLFGAAALLVVVLLLAAKLRSVWKKRRFRASAVSSPPSINASLLILLLCLWTGACSPRQSQDTRARPVKKTGFELTVWTVEQDVGPIAFLSSKTASFSVRNSGVVPAKLDFGHPSCSCTSMTVDRSTLAPGETAHIRMVITNQGEVGPFSSTLQLAAVNHDWADTLTVRAFGLGLSLPSEVIRKCEDSPKQVVTVPGILYTRQPTPNFRLSVTLADAYRNLTKCVTIDPPELSEPKPHANCFRRDVLIRIRPRPNWFHVKECPRILELAVELIADGIERTYPLFVEAAQLPESQN